MVTSIKLIDGNVNKSVASKYCLSGSINVRIAQKCLVKYFSFSGKVKNRAYHSPKVFLRGMDFKNPYSFHYLFQSVMLQQKQTPENLSFPNSPTQRGERDVLGYPANRKIQGIISPSLIPTLPQAGGTKVCQTFKTQITLSSMLTQLISPSIKKSSTCHHSELLF